MIFGKSKTGVTSSRIASYMEFNEKRLLVNSFLLSKFYCLLIWMGYNHTKNNKINRIHERWLRLMNISPTLCFVKFLGALQLKCMKYCMKCIEFNDAFLLRQTDQYNLKRSKFIISNVKTTNYGLESRIFRTNDMGDYIITSKRNTFFNKL